MNNLPEKISSVDELIELLSRPTEALVEMMKRIDGDFMFLGVGGKMGPTMALMALRATHKAGVTRKRG